MDQEPGIVQAAAAPVAVIRRSTTFEAWPRQWRTDLDAIWAAAKAGKITKPGRNVMIYRPRGAGNLDTECGVEVPAVFEGSGDVVCSATPSGRAAHAVHRGQFENVRATHAAVEDWCRANGHKLAGVVWEVYGHWNDDQSQLRTDVFHLLA